MAFQLTAAIADALGGAGVQQVDPSHNAARVTLRPPEHGAGGHYRAASISGALVSVGAAGIVGSMDMPLASPRQVVVSRIQVCLEVLTAVTTATPQDLQSFRYSGSSGNSASGAITSPTKMSSTHATSIFPIATGVAAGAQGGIRVSGTGALTAATGKTNDTGPLGTAMMQILTNVSATGVAVLVTAGNATIPYDIFAPSPIEHPCVLRGTEGIETQFITAGVATGTQKLTILYVWMETAQFGVQN